MRSRIIGGSTIQIAKGFFGALLLVALLRYLPIHGDNGEIAKIQESRRELASIREQLQQQLDRGALRTPAALDVLAREVQAASDGRIAWIQIRDGSGDLLGIAGPAAPVFAGVRVQRRLRTNKPVYTIRKSGGRTVVVEAFAAYIPAHLLHSSIQKAAFQIDYRPQLGVVEAAVYLDGRK